MRRGVVIAMSGLSVVAAGVGYGSSQRSLLAGRSTAAAPAGVVDAGVSPAAGRSVAPGQRRATAGPVAKPRPVTPPVSPTTVPTPRPAAPAPSRRAAPPTRPASPTARAATTTTVNGVPADTQYGPVQVQVSIRGRRIIRANAIDYPQSGGRDREINSYAIPQLNQETVDAQSANIDSVSGATYTSDGYRQSLQSALDAAHRAGAW
jgi:uncharacterized protein with FMN-binding domain